MKNIIFQCYHRKSGIIKYLILSYKLVKDMSWTNIEKMNIKNEIKY